MNDASVIKLFDYIIKHSSITESGMTHSDINMEYAIHELQLLLPGYSFSNINETLFRLTKRSEKWGIEDINKILEDTKKAKQIKVSIKKRFVIYLPINITIGESFKLRLLNKNIIFMKVDQVEKIIPHSYLNIDTIKQSIYQDNNIYITNTFAVINFASEDEDHSLRELWPIFQLIKSLIELHTSWGTRYIVHNTLAERGKIDMPDWVILKNLGEYKIIKFKLSLQGSKANQKISQRNINSIQKIANIIRKKDDERSLDFLIYRNLLLYNDALDQGDFSYCFLAFWQILETLALAERNGGDTKVVINRIEPLTEKILGNKITLRATLESFAKKRNDLVHRGIGNITNSDINMIKFMCEIALSWIINNKGKYKNINTLEQYFILRTNDRVKLNAITRAISIISRET